MHVFFLNKKELFTAKFTQNHVSLHSDLRGVKRRHDVRNNYKEENQNQKWSHNYFISSQSVSLHKIHFAEIPLTLLHNYKAPKLKPGMVLLRWENQSADGVAGQTAARRSNLILLIAVC